MIIRLAKLSDLPATVEIYNQAISAGGITAHLEPFTVAQRQEWFDSHQQTRFPLFVAEKDNQVVGYLTLSPYRSGRLALSKSTEVSYYVNYDYHHQGIGSSLMETALKFAQQHDFNVVLAILLSRNDSSIGLLKKYSFKLWGTIPEAAHFSEQGTFDHLYYGLSL